MDAALEIATHKVPTTLVLQRPGQVQAQMNPSKGDKDFATEMARIRAERRGFEECVQVASEDPLYTLYTSGTTGVPKVYEKKRED